MKYTRPVVDADLRTRIFEQLFGCIPLGEPDGYNKINDRQYGIILPDLNGVMRYCRVGIIVAEEREDMTAEELMAKEQAEYAEKQAKAQAKVEERARKAKADKARRAEKKEEEADDYSKEYAPHQLTDMLN